MTRTHRKRVLISEPNAVNLVPYLPYQWATLKTYHERHGAAAEAYEWLDPIYQHGDPDRLLAPYGDAAIDVLGLSCYTWNWQFQCRLARHVKARNPDCLVVVGGPDPAHKDPQFFVRHPEIDVVVINDGEIPFTRILDRVAEGHASHRDVRGLYLPDPDTRVPVNTGPPEVPVVFDYSPYIAQSDLFERLAKVHGPGVFYAVIETNRGCPYSCSYCDWGSNTMSKVRRFDIERVRAEIDWLARLKPFCLFLADGNFGILPRDLEIADLLCAARAKYGYPWIMIYSAAKNNPERSFEIARKFHVSGLAGVHSLAIQHTRKEVLAATKRENIPPEKQVELARALKEHNVPISVQLILGIPGDTYELWKGCFADLMEWGIHDDYQVLDYNLLPNAPAADKVFLDHWEVVTTECLVSTLQMPRARGEDGLLPCRIVVKCKTFSFADWVQMNVYATLARTLHGCCLTRWIACYLRHTHGVAYQAFYEDLIEQFMTSSPAMRRLRDALAQHFEDAAAGKCGLDELLTEQLLPAFDRYLSASRWALVQICLQFEAFWETLRHHLLKKYPGIEELDDLISYQKNLVVLPSYDCDAGKSFPVAYDWLEYFERMARHTEPGSLVGPVPAPGAEVLASDKLGGERGTVPLDWHKKSSDLRWIQWIQQVVYHRGCAAKNNLHVLQIRRPEGARMRKPIGVL